MSAFKKLSGHLAGIKNKIPGFRKTTAQGDNANELIESATESVATPKNRIFKVFGNKAASNLNTAKTSVMNILENTVDKYTKKIDEIDGKLNKLKTNPNSSFNFDDFDKFQKSSAYRQLESENIDAADKLFNARKSNMDELTKSQEAVENLKSKSRMDVLKNVNERTDEIVSGTKKYKEGQGIRQWSKKTKAAAIVGTTAAVAGIHAGVTGKSFKEANKDVIGTLREGASPITQTTGVIAGGAVAIGAEGATSIVKAGVDSSGPLLEELGKGASSIGGALGFGLPDFGFGDMDGILFVVVLIAIYYFFTKSSSSTSSNLDSVIYN